MALAALLAWWGQSAGPEQTLLRAETSAPPAPVQASGLWHPPQVSALARQSSAASGAPPAADALMGSDTAERPADDAYLSPGFVSASLRALAAHGLRLNQPQVSLHTVQTRDLRTAQALGRWARAQGYAVRAPIKVLEHGGEANWVLPIERYAVLDETQILADGQHIRARALQSPGARYHAWQVSVAGRSTLSGAAQS